MTRAGLLIIACVGALALPACSALVTPDGSRLTPPSGSLDASARDGGAIEIDGAAPDGSARRDGGGGAPDAGPMCPPSCDDGVTCTDDACVAGRCENTPNDAACIDGERCSRVMGCVPLRCAEDRDCDDGLYCNGAERCDASAPGSGCVAGAAVTCDDGATCSDDYCDEDTDACGATLVDARCVDAFACTVDACAPADTGRPDGCVHEADDAACDTDFCVVGRRCDVTAGCAGGTPRSCADATACTTDACDSAARMCVNAPLDADDDGVPAAFVMDASGATSTCPGADCDDGNAAVRPGAPEHCNMIDDDCDGMTDEGCPVRLPDTCATAQAIAVGAGGTATVRGTFAALANDYTSNPLCMPGSGGRDAVYYIDLPMGRWDLTIDTIGAAADTILDVAFECSADAFASRSVCNDDHDAGATTASRVWVHNVSSSPVSATRVYVLVDAYSSSASGDYVLNVRRAPAAPDACATAGGALPLDISGGGTVLGFMQGFTGSHRGTCMRDGDVSPEGIFRVRATSGRMRFTTYSTEFTPHTYLRRAPCSGGTEIGCDLGSSIGGGVNESSLERSVSSGELYYFFADGGRTTYAVYYRPN